MTSTIAPVSLQSPAPLAAPSMGEAGRPSASFGGFLDLAKAGLSEVSRLQADATAATEQLALGETDDVVGVMATVEKGELAFKTLLAIRSKLMAAYDEIRNMPV